MKALGMFLLLMLATVSTTALAGGYSNVSINGQHLTVPQLRALQQQLGYRVQPGNYLYNAYNGCWANLSNGQSGCLGGRGGMRSNRSGSGAWDGRGNWSSWSDYGGGVGGTSNGCIYTSNWSNC